MMKGTFDIASVLTFVLTIVPAIYKLLRPLITAKIETQKSENTRHDLEIADDYAAAIVAEMAVMANLSSADRKTEAVRFVINAMQDLGKTISTETAGAKVEAAYQNYKNNIGGDVHKVSKTIEATADPDPDDQSEVN
ncbi:hypothetical protein [Levilactobacillus huananensis]|uniref:hypothetical protein n=1 Tax=Levilactobacillus huananensis TaxID=2486019 RepID=UPI000F7B91F9|nr:hypothetical protein [Levilactobacillus huananensis]